MSTRETAFIISLERLELDRHKSTVEFLVHTLGTKIQIVDWNAVPSSLDLAILVQPVARLLTDVVNPRIFRTATL